MRIARLHAYMSRVPRIMDIAFTQTLTPQRALEVGAVADRYLAMSRDILFRIATHDDTSELDDLFGGDEDEETRLARDPDVMLDRMRESLFEDGLRVEDDPLWSKHRKTSI